MELSDVLDACVTWAISLGPSARYVLPVAGAAMGLVLVALGWFVASQRTAWRARELFAATRMRVSTEEPGKRVALLGRLRVPGGRGVPSFARPDRDVVVSSLEGRVDGARQPLATRAAEGLALETRDGLVPLEGVIDVRRTRGAARADNVDARTRARAFGATSLRASDLREGQWVLAAGLLGHIGREALREQGAVRGLSGAGAPIELVPLRPEVPRWMLTASVIGAIALSLAMTPLPWPIPALMPLRRGPASDVLLTARLLGPTREATLRAMADSRVDPTERRWFAMARQELGDCATAILVFAAIRRDEEALALLDREDCAVEPLLRMQLLRESGLAARALEASQVLVLNDRQRRALADEAGLASEDEGLLRAAALEPPRQDGLACDVGCTSAILGAGEDALERVEQRHANRRAGLPCASEDVRFHLDELGLECGRFTPREGLEAARLSPRPSSIEPLSRVEARLYVLRVLLEQGGDVEGARAVRARQRRILAILATPSGARAERRWIEPGQPVFIPPEPRPWRPEDGCNPFEGLTEWQIREQTGQ